MMNNPTLSVVIPVFNSKDVIVDTTHKLLQVLSATGLTYEIILRDDGSDKETKFLLQRLEATFEEVVCRYNRVNKGLGFTLRELFNEARGEYIICMDHDLPYGPQLIYQLLDEIKEADIVVASKYGDFKNNIIFTRKFVSRLYQYICKIVFKCPVKDLGSGSFIFRRNILDDFKLTLNGFAIHIEFYVKSLSNNFRIKEVPAMTTGKEMHTFNILKHGPKIIGETYKLYKEINYI